MKINLDVNELVAQITSAVSEQSKSLREFYILKEENAKLKSKLMDFETEEVSRKYKYERELNDMASSFENEMKKVVNG